MSVMYDNAYRPRMAVKNECHQSSLLIVHVT